MKFLVMGLPGSGKTTLAKPFAELIGAIHLDGNEIRTRYDDLDLSCHGCLKQAERMRHLADGCVLAGKMVVADFVCPLDWTRKEFDADYTIFMDTIETSKHEDTNVMFMPPFASEIDYHVKEWFDDTHAQLMLVIDNYLAKKDDIKHDRPSGTSMKNLLVTKQK